MKKYKKLILLLFSILVSTIAIANYLFYSKLNELKYPHISGQNISIEDDIVFFSKNLHVLYSNSKHDPSNITDIFIKNIRKYESLNNVTNLWKVLNSWVSKQHVVNHTHEDVGKIFAALKFIPIVRADLDKRGSQLKFLLTLEVESFTSLTK